MTRILVCDGMDNDAMKSLIEAGYEVVNKHYEGEELNAAVKEFDAMIVRSATKVRKPLIDKALETGRLKLIIRAGVGIDNIDAEYARDQGITVSNTPNASSASVAELAIAHMFTIARFVHVANVTMRQDQWNKKQYKGIELSGKKLGLIGFGRIARETAKRAEALGMEIYYTDILGPNMDYDQYTYLPIEILIREVDFISLHMPYNKEMGPTLGKNEFKDMKEGMYIINTARGGVVDEEALLDALDTGKVAAAAVDVFIEEPTPNKELYNHPRVSVTPHIGALTKEAQKRIGTEIIDRIKSFFE